MLSGTSGFRESKWARELTTCSGNGRLLAAHLYLQKRTRTTVAHSRPEPGRIVVDFAADGTPLGLEFVAPSKVSLTAVNKVLQASGQAVASADDLWPILHRNGRATSAA